MYISLQLWVAVVVRLQIGVPPETAIFQDREQAKLWGYDLRDRLREENPGVAVDVHIMQRSV